jgi:hypothetical protein
VPNPILRRSCCHIRRERLQLGRTLRPEAGLEELGVAEAQRNRIFDLRFERGKVSRASKPSRSFE